MHVLRKNALESNARDETPMPADATYDAIAGAWRTPMGLLAYDADQVRVTKKADVETGEDQKGP